jgi:hypothetical protein
MNRRSFFSLIAKAAIAVVVAPAKFFAPAPPQVLFVTDWAKFDDILKRVYLRRITSEEERQP